MEDGSETNKQLSEPMKNGDVNSIMANFPEGTVTEAKDDKNATESSKVNGGHNQEFEEPNSNLYQDSYSSESDALVIDESVPKKKKVKGKHNKKSKEIVRRTSEKENEHEIFSSSNDTQEKISSDKKATSESIKDFLTNDQSCNRKVQISSDNLDIVTQNSSSDKESSKHFSLHRDNLEPIVNKSHDCDNSRISSELNNTRELLTHSNPYFNESLFELSQLHHANEETTITKSNLTSGREINSTCSRSKRVKPKPKLKEYAQYLGLQPAVQFKCPKCGKSGFESLPLLQDHFLQCNAVQILEKTTENENISGFKLTRKVFLCSACGTYYENWNLYMHMLEYHKRYICLYCLGMFSILDDLCQHIQSRHNLEPGIKNTLEDFYNTYTEPCYVVCCECNRQFNEGDNFFYHNCVPVKAPGKNKAKTIKQIIAPENHITGDSIMVPQETTQTNSEKKDKGVKDNCMNNSECQYENVKGVPCDDQESENNQVDSAKHNLIETETSKQSVSDFSENADESFTSVKERLSVTKEINDINKQMNTDFEEGINKDTCFDNAQDCEQDSLDSNKNSDEGMDNHNSTENTMDAIEDHLSDNNELDEVHEVEEEVETRKVPKLSLKLPKPNDYPDPEDSDDSDKLAMEIDNIESENDNDQEKSDTELPKDKLEETEKDIKVPDIQYPIAGLDIPIIELELDQPLDKMDIKILLQKCLQATAPTCIYCNHSRRIAVNGKQLGLHAIAEHRYSAINKSITAEELIPESFNSRIKECLEQLEQVFFNLDSGASEEAVTFSHVFECFQCHYSTTVHKELYLHNRKFHSKNLLLCIMCKSNFYSYSELICHLCPGVYILDYDLQFRCCMCVSDDLPSSFRLMVHLRKRHNVCDVCLEMCHSQYKLSNHVWKHKLHHFCYRCGIAYRNKPDITRHLFWKHGTESVLCKKCLQKKWPHVYHFCVPPTSFTCEECSLVFSKAVSLKVHKRIHMDEKKHLCTWEDCTESFISKKLMLKHLKRHTDPPEEQKTDEEIKEDIENKGNEESEAVKNGDEIKGSEEPAKPIKPKVDVYDLPELNLSESDSSDSETEAEKSVTGDSTENKKTDEINAENDDDTKSKDELEQKSLIDIPQEEKPEDIVQPVDDTSSSVMQDIWDNFKNYQASKEKLDSMFTNEIDTKDEPYIPDIPIPVVEEELTWERALRDHDYCAEVEKVPTDTIIEVKPALESTERVDHDYCFQTETDKVESNHSKDVSETTKDVSDQAINKSPARKRTISSSSSSSDSDSSCACGSSCSCSNSSSDSSSSSSDSSNSDSSTEEGIKRQQQRRLKRKERNKTVNKEQETKVDVVTTEQSIVSVEMPINESDLETTESETDEEFYDREPQKFAKKILEEKRAQLLAEMGPNMVPNGSFIESTSRPPTPPAGTVEEEEQPKKKKKAKKRKKKKNEKRDALENRTYSATLIMDSNPPAQISTPSYYQQFHQVERQSPVASITLSLSRNSPAPQTPPLSLSVEPPCLSRQDSTASDTSLRASKRRRVPNKFYGYSSDEEGDKPKRNKIEINKTIPAPVSPMLVPPLTIKTGQSSMAVPPRPPVVEPITLRLPRPTHPPNDFKIQRKPSIPPIRLFPPRVPPSASRDESGTDSNDSDIDEPTQPPMESAKPRQPQLYCYCRCPYDEVSEMIGCDSNDCQIEWFHFECVGIMVPPKGQWFCPDCRKKKQQQRREMLS